MNSFKPKLGRRNPVKTEGHFLLRLCSFAWLAEKILKRLAKLLSLFGHPKKRALPIEVGFDTKCCLEKEVHFLLAGWIISMICIPPTSKILNWGASIPALEVFGGPQPPQPLSEGPQTTNQQKIPQAPKFTNTRVFQVFHTLATNYTGNRIFQWQPMSFLNPEKNPTSKSTKSSRSEAPGLSRSGKDHPGFRWFRFSRFPGVSPWWLLGDTGGDSWGVCLWKVIRYVLCIYIGMCTYVFMYMVYTICNDSCSSHHPILSFSQTFTRASRGWNGLLGSSVRE